ncbi:MAG TPA: sulfatase-like hydrolase/transferase [Vicinamibacterales bacterium]
MLRTSRRFAFVVCVLTFVAAACSRLPAERPATSAVVAPRSASAPARPPSILLIVVDTLRYDAIVGSRAADAPFLSSLASLGTAFTRAYSTQDSTPASHFSMLSGFVTGWQTTLDDSAIGLPSQLSRKGYDTFGVAANGNLTPGALRVLAGFRRYSCLYDEWTAMTPDARAPYLQEITRRLDAYHARHNPWNEAMLYASATRVVAHVDALLTSAKPPFFGFVNLIEPHDPYLPAAGPGSADARVDPDLRFRALPRFLTDPASISDANRRTSIERREQLADGRAWSLSDDLPAAAIETYRSRYQRKVREADDAVRQVVGLLARRDLLDNTVVIVTSDHGEAFGEGGFMTHSLRNSGDRQALQHVPLIIVAPDAVRASVATLVTNADVAPTLYELAGVDWQPVAQESYVGNYGTSLVPYLGVSTSAGEPAESRATSPAPRDLDIARRRAAARLRALGYIK